MLYEIQCQTQGVHLLSCFVDANLRDAEIEACRIAAAKKEEFDDMEYDGTRSKLITRKSGRIIVRNITPYANQQKVSP